MKQLLRFIICLALSLSSLQAQVSHESLLSSFRWRNIGPANQGGRIVDIEAHENDFAHVYLGLGTGGIWKSTNAGTTWKPIFDQYETASIGDLALFQPNPDIIWVGTGEANNRNSLSWGNGVYKSTDGGKSFTHLGLAETHHIARIITHPTDPEQAYVAAVGHLWGYSGERGLFHTRDGGKSWKKLGKGLPNDGKTGCTDLVMDPTDPQVLYAAFYQRLRQPWHFHSGGPNGGIFKSTNGGKSWRKLTRGLPPGETGRIGLAICRSKHQVLMALVEAKRSTSLDTLGSGLYRSEDGGESWTYVNTYNNRPFYYSQVRINPLDDQRVYVLTTRFMVSEDGGTTLRNGSSDEEVHGDFHALWLDPTDRDRYYLGADKGASITHDHGQHFQLFDNLPIAQYYRIGVDMREPYYVYGGLQDNGMYGTASFGRDARGILNDHNWKLHWGDGQFIQPDPRDWRRVFTSMENGSFFHYDPLTHRIARIQPTAETIVNYKTAVPEAVRKSGRPFRFNWTSPMLLSPHNPDVLYAAGNYVFRTENDGRTWEIISPDLSTNDPEKRRHGNSGGITPDNTGAETHCAVYTLSLSTLDPELIWAGTDDGLVHVTRDGGKHWQNVRDQIPEVPQGLWVSRVDASHHSPGRAYVCFDGHRSDHFQPWVFRTDDFGKNWTRLGADLPPGEVVRVIREDRENPNLLFLGTEFGVWVSLDRGQQWHRFMPNLPTVPVLDLLVHPRDQDLIAGTHGRSLWIMDDISPLQQWHDSLQGQPGFVFKPSPSTLWENVSRGGQRGHFLFAGENPPEIRLLSSRPRARFGHQARISFWLSPDLQDSAKLIISHPAGHQRHYDLAPKGGIHHLDWDLEFEARPYSPAETAYVDSLFQALMAQHNFSSIRRAYAAFQQGMSPRAKRMAVERLRTGYLSFELDDRYGLPQAGTGTYQVELQAGAQRYRTTLEIREDPLLATPRRKR